jgi:hypothetical protein
MEIVNLFLDATQIIKILSRIIFAWDGITIYARMSLREFLYLTHRAKRKTGSALKEC